jgi:hypothetical protein
MKTQLSYLAAGVVAALALTGSPASAADLRAQIPFTFTVGERVLAAGTYHVSTAQGVLSVHGVEGGAFVMTGRLESEGWQKPTLVFERTGGSYVLRQAWTGGGNGRELSRESGEGSKVGAVAKDTARVEIPLL